MENRKQKMPADNERSCESDTVTCVRKKNIT